MSPVRGRLRRGRRGSARRRAARGCARRVFLHTMLRDLTGRAPLTGSLRGDDHACRRRAAGSAARARRGARRGPRPADRRGDRHTAGADRHRHGQAWRRRAQRVVRHRPRVRVPRGRRHGGTARDRQPRVLRPPRPPHRGRAERRDRRTATCSASTCGFGRTAKAAPLTTSFAGLEHYLLTQGRAWERYAWLKARAITGARHDELMALVTPFVYRKYLDYDAYEGPARRPSPDPRAGRAARRAGQREDRRRRHPRDRVHRRRRMQIVRGGREPDLRVRGTLPALAVLDERALCCRPRSCPRCATPTSSCATSSIDCSTATTRRPTSCRKTPTSAPGSPRP